MRALILAAGRGSRIRDRTARPKCLLEIEGVTLIDRYVEGLGALGIPMTIVLGYRDDTVRDHLRDLHPTAPVETVINHEYLLGSILSLHRGLEHVTGDLLLMDGDVLFHPDLLSRLARSRHGDALLVDVGSSFTGEEYMTGIDGGRVTALQRAPVTGHELAGEWVGFAKLSADTTGALRETIAARVAAEETGTGYEDSLASLLPTIDMRHEDASDLPWVEIDFPDDVTRAAELLPKLS